VIAVDTNVLVAAHRRDAELHTRAAGVLRDLAEGRRPWCLPWPCVHEFLAIVTHPRIFDGPSAPEQAVDQVDAWLESPTVELIAERFDHWEHLRELFLSSGARGALVHDARVAALCLEHGVTELCSADRDFGRFPRLRVRNPLVG
jgi:toxin-antitoxin system PIN domain toxin